MKKSAATRSAAPRRGPTQLLLLFFAAITGLCATAQAQTPHHLWFDRPAEDWERESLPIGNGAMGAAVQGGVTLDILQFNEKTLWTGGPGTREGKYDFGIPADPQTEALAEIRRELNTKGRLTPEYVARQLGRKAEAYGSYQNFGELRLTFPPSGEISGYRRQLDISEAIARVTYSADGVRYTREYLASYPDGVIAIHLKADRAGHINFTAELNIPHNRSAHRSVRQGRIAIRGKLLDNGLAYETQLQVIADGGSLTRTNEGGILVSDADTATLLLAAATDYAPVYPAYRSTISPHKTVQARVNRAHRKGWSALRAAHVADHRALFDRVSLHLNELPLAPSAGKQPPHQKTAALFTNIPIDQWLASYGSGNSAADRALEALYFQYGRYLLIASSRSGSLPANLQGVWNNSTTPPWNADYHTNINLQMNYWPAETTNLAETAIPLFDFVDTLRQPGHFAAEKLLGARGWTLFLNTNIWGFTGTIDWPTAFWQPEAGAWLATHYYEHYLFSHDEKFLRERAYPAMKGAALLWLDALVPDPRDGLLVVSPSYSPEHGDFTAGAAMSQQIVSELLRDTLNAALKLGDRAFAQQIEKTLDQLDPGLRIGSWGQLQEWKEDLDHPENKHRHVSQLFAIYPGIRSLPAPLLDAARTSLEARGDAGTGWSRAWKINLWARLGDGDRAHRILSAQLRQSTLPNLWSSHPPFQIDGNLGATAGIAEMLLQSHGQEIHLLPALPAAWPSGAVSGLRARGNTTVDMWWSKGQLQNAHITAYSSGQLKLRLPQNGNFSLRRASDNKIVGQSEGAHIKIFNAQPGESYLLTKANSEVTRK
ncbi:glycoside hydrolase family 95 protein [Microbulbifer thermotolerans]|uniref:glycoside hydrolase family 95 protein n=1 Tax=Microbulbifer thermotolerans TaxID=252514 RepID=UPI0026736495|nr:glycoside hydrolase family 95 protein [Microbulbifer thermotolerans]WKT60013.1 glycoside hydrolase family 95 protein [Microbulbifer thermotolerans]